LAGRNTPDYVNRLIGSIVFQHQNTWPLRVHWVVLDHGGTLQAVNDVTHGDIVGGDLVVSVQ